MSSRSLGGVSQFTERSDGNPPELCCLQFLVVAEGPLELAIAVAFDEVGFCMASELQIAVPNRNHAHHPLLAIHVELDEIILVHAP